MVQRGIRGPAAFDTGFKFRQFVIGERQLLMVKFGVVVLKFAQCLHRLAVHPVGTGRVFNRGRKHGGGGAAAHGLGGGQKALQLAQLVQGRRHSGAIDREHTVVTAGRTTKAQCCNGDHGEYRAGDAVEFHAQSTPDISGEFVTKRLHPNLIIGNLTGFVKGRGRKTAFFRCFETVARQFFVHFSASFSTSNTFRMISMGFSPGFRRTAR
ncbi:hypothetical protein SDC9_162465 [bioreactor metagenome]|uniref:Uncharacterized protein n=1 Tax=bioreactor metagenome TaxID=1076179 RepID=A0A645FN82_9ZZZZ